MQEEMKTKDRLFNAALELYSQYGYYGVSIKDLTDAAGITKASFYNHYKTKDELVDSLFAYFAGELEKAGPPLGQYEKMIQSMPVKDFLLGGLEIFKGTFSLPAMQKIWKVLSMEQFRDKRARDFLLKAFYRLPAELAAWVFGIMMKNGLIGETDPARLADEFQYPLSAMLAEFLLLRLDGQDTAAIEGKMRAHIVFFCEKVLPVA